MSFWIINSMTMQDITETEVTIRAPIPKYTSEIIKAGARAITTPHMICFTFMSPFT
jgi:hypothetical protein